MRDFSNPVSLTGLNIESFTYGPNFYIEIAAPVQYLHYRQELSEFVCLPQNWDGYGAIPLELAAYENANHFLDQIDRGILKYLSQESLQPTPYGTVIMDFQKGHDLVSVEIGNDKIGFFTKFKNHKNFFSNGESYPYSSIPAKLQQALKIIDNAL
ncbi:MAG: hypothetical protein IKB70_12395 [Bacilli bacterium]|jgi:hypothetical protein|nr:hypothetical protein [Bacilli bacterium]